MDALIDLLLDLAIFTNVKKYPYLYAGIALSGIGLILLVGFGLGESPATAVIVAGATVLVVGIVLAAVGIREWFRGPMKD